MFKRKSNEISINYFLLLLNFNSFGQDYIEYQKIINRIDEDLLSKNYHSAIKRFDSLYSNFDFIYSIFSSWSHFVLISSFTFISFISIILVSSWITTY